MTRPYGMAGGEAGMAGRNVRIRHDATAEEELPAAAHFRVQHGDVLRIETPGGGGWGTPI
jgi:N-methylhydantoinase B